MLGRGPRESGVRGVDYFMSSSNLACFSIYVKGIYRFRGIFDNDQ
ncbi:hypothetical protein RchiOBHm_Chr5g0006881 [Rosa chinensis]|uniref:Uncharacterized protein n=1 Tax=Rosa chinensis TaxID=74649 RepID=A0A2P6Q3N0_ROSCH|nr:hypothetical protein RchiOBHm_Chr5g0006881 [Rosa chinensis]